LRQTNLIDCPDHLDILPSSNEDTFRAPVSVDEDLTLQRLKLYCTEIRKMLHIPEVYSR